MSDQIARAFSGRRVLVTGGAGFVGGALVRRLAEADARVTVLDDLFTGRPDTVSDERPARDGLGRRRGPRALPRRRRVGGVPHGRPEHHRRPKDPRQDFATNIGGTLNVLLAARDSKVDRVVYTGSTSIYGNPPHDPDQRGRPAGRCSRRTRSASSAASSTATRSTRTTACRSRSSAIRTSSASASARTTRTAASSASSSPPRSRASRSRSTATASRPATTPTSTTRSTRPSWRRSGRGPRARSSTSGRASRRRSTSSP